MRACAGVAAIFFANGLRGDARAAAIFVIKALFSLSDGGISIVLLAAGVGGLAAMLVAGMLPPKIESAGRALRISGRRPRLPLAALPQTLSCRRASGFRSVRVPVRLAQQSLAENQKPG